MREWQSAIKVSSPASVHKWTLTPQSDLLQSTDNQLTECSKQNKLTAWQWSAPIGDLLEIPPQSDHVVEIRVRRPWPPSQGCKSIKSDLVSDGNKSLDKRKLSERSSSVRWQSANWLQGARQTDQLAMKRFQQCLRSSPLSKRSNKNDNQQCLRNLWK